MCGYNLPEHVIVLAQVIAGRGLDVLVTSQIFDVRDISSVIAQVGAEGVP